MPNAALLHVARHCPQLRQLSLGQERGGVLDVASGLYAIALHRPSLRTLDAQPGTYFSDAAVAHLKLITPHIRVIENFYPPFFNAGFDMEF